VLESFLTARVYIKYLACVYCGIREDQRVLPRGESEGDNKTGIKDVHPLPSGHWIGRSYGRMITYANNRHSSHAVAIAVAPLKSSPTGGVPRSGWQWLPVCTIC